MICRLALGLCPRDLPMHPTPGSPLGDVSYKLGTLDANVAILVQRADRRDAEMKLQTETLEEIKNTLKPFTEDMKFMKPHVRHYAGIRRRAAWVGGVLFTIGGTIGGTIGNYLVKKYGA